MNLMAELLDPLLKQQQQAGPVCVIAENLAVAIAVQHDVIDRSGKMQTRFSLAIETSAGI